MQVNLWPYCGFDNKCRKKMIIHCPDLAVVHQEAVSIQPLNSTPYHVPLLIIEVEGAKDVWGLGKQEHKALEEAAATLAFIPETYLLFIYHNRFEFWHIVRNPIDGSVDVKAYPVYVQQGSTIPFRAQMQKILVRIIKILAKQCISGAEVLRLSESEYRKDGWLPYKDAGPTRVQLCAPIAGFSHSLYQPQTIVLISWATMTNCLKSSRLGTNCVSTNCSVIIQNYINYMTVY